MEILYYAAGVIIMAFAIAVSIALHEVGHLVPAKLFGVRVPQYMIGFGKTIFSFRRGETEYGFKAIPLGGYISMIGMYPPAAQEKENTDASAEEDASIEREKVTVSAAAGTVAGRAASETAEPPGDTAEPAEKHAVPQRQVRSGNTSLLASLSAAAREADAERIQPGDENRLFYKLPVYKRIIIMLGGPFMNLLIGVVCTAILICGFGLPTATNKVSSVSECVPTVSMNTDSITYEECSASSQPSPAKTAGLRAGDTVLAVNGAETSSWTAVSSAIRAAGTTPSEIKIMRDGREQTLTITPVQLVRPVVDEQTGQYARNEDGSFKTVSGGFVGISPTSELKPGNLSDVPPNVGHTLARIAGSMWSLPQRVWDLGVTLVTNGDRDANSPVSVVGVSRIAGEVASTDQIDRTSKEATLVSLVASMNLMLFAFNLIPLLPLDGGHVFGALWEATRRAFAKLTRREDPGPFDPIKLMPLTYVVAGAFILMSVILIAADIIKPIRLF